MSSHYAVTQKCHIFIMSHDNVDNTENIQKSS